MRDTTISAIRKNHIHLKPLGEVLSDVWRLYRGFIIAMGGGRYEKKEKRYGRRLRDGETLQRGPRAAEGREEVL